MKINYTCYSIRKFFLIFLAITSQVGIINATTKKEKFIQEYTKIMNNSHNKSWELYNLLKEENDKEVIDYENDTFINTIKTDDDKTALQVGFSSFYGNDAWGQNLIKELLKFDKLNVNQIKNPKKLEEKETGLAYCMYTREYEYALIMLNHPNIDVNVKFSSNHSYQGETTVLMEALHFEEKEIIKKLLTGTYKNPLKVNEKNKQGKTALIYAIMTGNSDAVEWLLAKKHNLHVNQKHQLKIYDITTEKHKVEVTTPLMYAIDLLGEKNGEWLAMKLQLSENTKESLRNEIIPLLITHDDTDLNLTDKQGLTALIHAIYFGEVGIVESLLGKKKNNKIVVKVNQKFNISLNEFYELNDETALMYAIYLLCNKEEPNDNIQCKKNLKKIIDLLIASSDLTVVNKSNDTALIIALDYLYNRLKNDPEFDLPDKVNKYVVKSLIEIIPNLLNAKNVNIKGTYNKVTALMLAIKTKQEVLVNKLLNMSNVDVDIEDRNGETAIFYAMEYYHKPIYKKILNRTKELNKENKHDTTPLMKLFSLGDDDKMTPEEHEELITEFLQKLNESNPNKDLVNYKNKKGLTILNALMLGYIEGLKNLEKNKTEKLKIKYKEDKIAINKKCASKVKILLEGGADPTITFKDPDDGQEKTAISLITDELVRENEELGTLKSSLEEAKKNNKKVKDNNKDPQTKDQDTPIRDQDPSQNQDEGNGMNIGAVVIIITLVGSLVVGAIVAVPLLFKKKKATKEDNDQSKDNAAKPKSIST